uniref:Uncharacterized protein n=1 Tax=Oryza brachyantha TaxID=4533 RepID=J3LAH7_ORYBR
MVMVQADSSATGAAAAWGAGVAEEAEVDAGGGASVLTVPAVEGGWENGAPAGGGGGAAGTELAVAAVAGIDGVAIRARAGGVSCSSRSGEAYLSAAHHPLRRDGPRRPTKQRAGERLRSLGLVPPRRF